MQITKVVMIMMTMIKTMPIKIIILEPSLKEKEIVEGQNQYKKKFIPGHYCGFIDRGILFWIEHQTLTQENSRIQRLSL